MPDSAPLIATPEAPIPAGGLAEWVSGAGGLRLRAALFPSLGEARGSVILSPGRTEPIEKYFEVVDRLRERGLTVLVHDWRGQGLSHRLLPDRQLGHAHGYTDFIADYGLLLAHYESRLPKPWIALGHSMGGCLTLLALAKGEARFASAILSGPMLGLSLNGLPGPLVRLVAKGLCVIGMADRQVAGRGNGAPVPFADNILTHDPRRYARNEAQLVACPDLALGHPTWGWLDFAYQATRELREGAGATRITTPLTVVAAGEEKLVDNAAAAVITARVPGARYVVAPGASHEILQELDSLQAPFWSEFDSLTGRLGL